MSTIERRHSTNFKRALTNYFRLTAVDDDVTFTIYIGSTINTTLLSYIEYSINEGKTWTRVTNVNSTTKTATIPNISLGSSVLFRGKGISLEPTNTQFADAAVTLFRGNKKYKVSGVIMTLLKGKWADENTSIGTQLYTFKALFNNQTNLVDAGDLILPPDITNYCYFATFRKTNITRAPELKALTLKNYCYAQMFSECTNLTYIKMLATSVSASNCLLDWMPLSNNKLEFHKNPEATWWVTGKPGFPYQCVLFDDTEETAEEETFIDSEVHRIILANWGNRKPKDLTYSWGGKTRYYWKGGIRIGGIQGKILKRQLANVVTILTEFKGNTSIVDFSDFALKFPNLLTIGVDGVTYYGTQSSCFLNCTSLKHITIPNKVRYLGAAYTYGNGCFKNSGIEEIYIPDSVTTASDYLFYNCTKLKTVRWSSNLPIRVNTTDHYSNVFDCCSNLETIENYPTTTGSIVPYRNWYRCSKLDISQFYPILLGAINIGSGAISGTNATNLPQDLIFYNLVSCNGASPGNLAGVGRRRLFCPKVTTISLYGLGGNSASLIDLGNVTGTWFYPGLGNSSTNTVTVILRSTAVPTFSTFKKDNVRRIYVYSSIIDNFKADSKCSTAASITYPIGGEKWFADFGSYYEYADYPMSDTIVFDEATDNSISIDFPIYNPDVTFNLYFNGSNYRSIVLPFADIEWEQARMGGDEMKEITGVTATVDGEENLTGFTVLYATATTIVANKPYIITSGMNGAGVGNNDYSESLIALGVVLKTTPTTDEFTSNGYKFSFIGTYELIDNMEGKYAFNGTDWVLCTSANTMKPTYVYLEITKIEE